MTAYRYLFVIVLIDGTEKIETYIGIDMNVFNELVMNNLNSNHLNILDLPDEILFNIFKKLNMVDVLYSLVDVNQRFHRLALDSFYIRDLDMTITTNINSFNDQSSASDTQVLSTICEKVLPRIHHQVHKLTVEQYSMKQVLLAANYPQLYSLSLINFRKKILYRYLTGNLIFRDLLTKQVTHLHIDIKKLTNRCSRTVSKIFALILSLCKQLTDLDFCDMFPTRKYETPIYLQSRSIMSTTLIKLKINVENFADCLYLLDGRLNSLSTLIINVEQIFGPVMDIGGRKKLPNLKLFSFTTFDPICDYDTLIVPLLCRLINLEELKLYLPIMRLNSTFIDGIQLYDQFLIYMAELKKFTFNIETRVFNRNITVELQSNEDIQRSFIGRYYQQVASYVHIKSHRHDSEDKCHIYSIPYDFEYFIDVVDNCFQGGMFHKVRELKMNDTIGFKHKLFQLISQGFPFLELLDISNSHRMKDKEPSYTMITFPYLIFLNLEYAHVDYAELFLLKKNTHLPRLLNLSIKCKSLTKLTNNFTNDATHFNFGKLKNLDVRQSFVRPKNFHEYFPLL